MCVAVPRALQSDPTAALRPTAPLWVLCQAFGSVEGAGSGPAVGDDQVTAHALPEFSEQQSWCGNPGSLTQQLR